MKKNTIILLLLSYHCMAKPTTPSVIDGIKNLAYIYADQAVAGGIHAAGHLLSAKLAILTGATANHKTIGYSILLMPYLKIPYAIGTNTPNFSNKNIHDLVDLAGPIAGLIGCYLRLKINNIRTEYNSKKTIAQNIKAGLVKPFYKGHSNVIAYNTAFRTLVECTRLIPGQHCTPER